MYICIWKLYVWVIHPACSIITIVRILVAPKANRTIDVVDVSTIIIQHYLRKQVLDFFWKVIFFFFFFKYFRLTWINFVLVEFYPELCLSRWVTGVHFRAGASYFMISCLCLPCCGFNQREITLRDVKRCRKRSNLFRWSLQSVCIFNHWQTAKAAYYFLLCL